MERTTGIPVVVRTLGGGINEQHNLHRWFDRCHRSYLVFLWAPMIVGAFLAFMQGLLASLA